MKFNAFLTFISLTLFSYQTLAVPHHPRDDGNNQKDWLKLHNKERREHNANKLSWDDDLAQRAQQYAEQCKLEVLDVAPLGQNLGYGYKPNEVFELWNAMEANYPNDVEEATPWMQIVYKPTQSVGCGSASCPGYGEMKWTLNVCLYDVAISEDYANNIGPGNGGQGKKKPSKEEKDKITKPPKKEGQSQEKEKKPEEHKEEEQSSGEDTSRLDRAASVIQGFKDKIGSDPTGMTKTWNKRDIRQI
uniref:Pathogenesis-related protein 1 n=1 Tax=Moniliophthora roreri TaxID=221103 RepID=A0A8E6YBC0_MONRR|nr:pathogenesis-related protein 1 [Moniliophthora roreri]